MIKLHPETAQSIANLINTMDVAELMHTDEPNIDNRLYWQATGFNAAITLHDDYGIEVSMYEQSKRNMKLPLYRDAKLA
tara:strand:+ start:101 stop:337 length:237 start_codon:yes stop_codon:yes gene_type:complete